MRQEGECSLADLHVVSSLNLGEGKVQKLCWNHPAPAAQPAAAGQHRLETLLWSWNMLSPEPCPACPWRVLMPVAGRLLHGAGSTQLTFTRHGIVAEPRQLASGFPPCLFHLLLLLSESCWKTPRRRHQCHPWRAMPSYSFFSSMALAASSAQRRPALSIVQ